MEEVGFVVPLIMLCLLSVVTGLTTALVHIDGVSLVQLVWCLHCTKPSARTSASASSHTSTSPNANANTNTSSITSVVIATTYDVYLEG